MKDRNIIFTGLIITSLRFILSFLFIFSGFFKLIDLESFENTISRFEILIYFNPAFIAIVIPVLEIMLGFLLLIQYRVRYISLSLIIVMSSFTSLLISQIDSGANFSCHCFGFLSDNSIDWDLVLRNILIIIGLLVIYTNDGSPLPIEKFITSITTAVVIFIGTQSIALSLENNILKERVAILLNTNRLKVGDTLRIDDASDHDIGNTITQFEHDTTGMLFLALNRRCNACSKNILPWNKITIKANNNFIKVFILSSDHIDSTKRYADENKIIYDEILTDMNTLYRSFKILSIPQTIFIKKGVVQNIWHDVLSEKDQN